MYLLHITGEMPAHWREALAELRHDLGFDLSADGIRVVCIRGQELAVESDGRAVRLTWAVPVQFYRALSLIPRPLAPCDIHETPRFETAGVMFDCSRNAVLKPDALRFFLRKMALMGLNLGMMYTEDTFEVPEQPYFGYKRGRYTYEELKTLDDYADMLGIELCPCIQTLGHMKRMLHWPALRHLQDNEKTLLADLDETYEFLEQVIRAAIAPYRSKRIHIGMDEAHGVGLGNHLRRWGYEDPHRVMGRHLKRVLDITDKYGLKPMMWSDMFFRLDGDGGYYWEGMPSEEAKQMVDPRAALVYWDYYHDKEEEYASHLAQHACFDALTVFAGGIWIWPGPAPSYYTTIPNTVSALTACMKAGVPLVFATTWGDDGAETNMLAALLGMQLYGEMTYTGVYDDDALRARFRRCCNADPQAFLDMSLFHTVPGMRSIPSDPCTAGRVLLYQDPLIQLFEADTAGLAMSQHYRELTDRFVRYASQNEDPSYQLLLDFYAALGKVLTIKCTWHEQAAGAVRRGDRKQAAEPAGLIPPAIEAVEALRRVWRTLWESTNKPQGFEGIDLRLGGVRARLSTAGEKMRAFADGETDDIPELSEASLPYLLRPDGTTACCYSAVDISTPSSYGA